MIDRIFEYLEPLIQYTGRKPIRIVVVSMVLAGMGLILLTQLKIDNDLSNLIPGSYPSVQALDKLREQVGAENEVAVVIESPSFNANRRFAEALIPKALQLRDPKTDSLLFFRYEYRKETSFLENNALYFATDAELERIEQFLEDNIEQAKKEANPFYIELEEDEEETARIDSVGDELEQAYDELVGSEYPVSDDSLTMAIKLYPRGSQADIGLVERTYDELQSLVDRMNPGNYHPEMEITLAGRLLRILIEIKSITQDVKSSFGKGVLMLMLIVVGYFLFKNYQTRSGNRFSFNILLSEIFRTPVTALILVLPLAASICWTFGLTYLLYQKLNVMTSTLFLLLFGMGIDFGIHFYARYAEERGKRFSVHDSIHTTFMTTGKAIFVVGLTTSAAFFILTIADFRGFSEFGAIAGMGLLFAIIAMIFFLPALLVLFEQTGIMNLENNHHQLTPLHRDGSGSSSGIPWKMISLVIILAAAVGTVLALYKAPGVTFEYDFGKLEPEYTGYTELNKKARRVYSDRKTRNAAYVITENPGDALAVADTLRRRAERDTLTPTILEVETLQDRFPFSDPDAREKLAHIDTIRNLLNDPFIKGSEDKNLERLRKASGTRSPIPLEKIPEFIKEPFTSRDGEVGNLVIIYPSVGLADGRNSMKFAADVSQIELVNGKTYYAGSTSVVASDMLRLMIEETPLMVALTVLFIIVFKMFILHRIKWMLLALLPLVASFLWLFGLMVMFGWKLNFYNLVILPTILGIGDDSGIHIVHRYLEEGKGSISNVLYSTGEHITVSAFTTMMGFGGLLFSMHPGMRSIGEVAILGIGLTLVAALIVLPALLKIMESFGEHTRDKQPPVPLKRPSGKKTTQESGRSE